MKPLSMEELITGKVSITPHTQPRRLRGRQKPSGNNGLIAYAIMHSRKRCVFYAGSKEAAKSIFKDLKNNLEITHYLDHANEAERKVMLKNGTTIRVIAINDEYSFRGMRFDAIAVHKDCKRDDKFLQQTIRPCTVEGGLLFSAVSPFSPMLEDFKPAMVSQSPIPLYEG